MRNQIKAWSLAFSLVWLLCSKVPAEAGPFMFNLDVPAGKWKATKLSNLTKGTVLSLQVESNGGILVAVLDSQNYQGKPDTERPLFVGQVERRLSVTVPIAEQGDHYILLDNRRGNESRLVKIVVQTTRGSGGQVPSTADMLQDFQRRFRNLFVLGPFAISVKKCESAKPSPDPREILLCREYVDGLSRALNDQEKTNDFFAFSLFHEVGRMLLSAWKEPAAATVEASDELAAVLMVMVNQRERASRASRFAMQNPLSLRLVRDGTHDERHPLSPERARNVLKWIEDNETVRRWQKTLVPHMQTALLKRLKQKPTLWTDLSLVEKELANRNKTSV
jgi:hypothetical protein